MAERWHALSVWPYRLWKSWSGMNQWERRGAREAADTLPRFHKIFSLWRGRMYVFVYRCVCTTGCAWGVIERLHELEGKNRRLDPVHIFIAMTRFTSPYATSLCIRTIYYNRFLCSMYRTSLPTLQLFCIRSTGFCSNCFQLASHIFSAEHRFVQHFPIWLSNWRLVAALHDWLVL